MEDLRNASKLLVKAMEMRESYMKMSNQSFPETCKKFLKNRSGSAVDLMVHQDRATIEGMISDI